MLRPVVGVFPISLPDWKILNPGKKLVGRAFTVQFMPTRPDVAGAMQAEAEKKGPGRLRNQTVIDMLQPGDVIVVDPFVKIIPTGMPAYFRGSAPDALNNVMLTGINIPIRIGNVTVIPGGVVLGDQEGLLFIPPHLVKPAIDTAAGTKARDEWIKSKMDTRQYKSSDLYGTPLRPGVAQGNGRLY